VPFNLLLLPLLGGYTFLTRWNRTRFSTKRYTGERLLFHSAFAGAVFLLAAFFIVHTVAAVAPNLHHWWAHQVPFPYAGTSLLAFLLGSLSWIPANLFYPKEQEARRVVQEWGDHLEILFDRAQTENRQISLTLKGGKVYIGFVLENFDPSYDRKYVTILPMASGYRNSADHRVVLTTPYSDVYASMLESERTDLKASDFKVVIPVAEVQSANLFDWDAYDEFDNVSKGGLGDVPAHASPPKLHEPAPARVPAPGPSPSPPAADREAPTPPGRKVAPKE
jgi:hypothetical protein